MGVLPTMGITASHIMNSIIMMSSRIMDTIMGTILIMSSLIMGTILVMGITASRIMDTIIMMGSRIMDTIRDTVLMMRSRGLGASHSKVRLRPLLCTPFPRWSCQCECPWGRLRLWRHLRWLCPRRRRC